MRDDACTLQPWSFDPAPSPGLTWQRVGGSQARAPARTSRSIAKQPRTPRGQSFLWARAAPTDDVTSAPPAAPTTFGAKKQSVYCRVKTPRPTAFPGPPFSLLAYRALCDTWERDPTAWSPPGLPFPFVEPVLAQPMSVKSAEVARPWLGGPGRTPKGIGQ